MSRFEDRFEQAEPVEPPAAPQLDPLPGRAEPADWAGIHAPPRRFIIEGWLARQSAGLLGGQDGVGKSLMAQMMATCGAAALPFLGLSMERVRSIYITCEDPTEELHRRQESINKALGITMEGLQGRLRTYSLKGQLNNELGEQDDRGLIRPSARYHQIRAEALEFGANLIFIDNAAHVFSGNENNRHDVATFLGLLERLSEEIDGAVVLLAHPNKQFNQGNKQGNEYSGSTGWSAHVRNRLFLDWDSGEEGEITDPDMRVLRRSKANYAQRGEEIKFRWYQWAFVLPDHIPPDARGENAANALAATENMRFLDCLDKLTAQKRSVSHSPNAGNYAPKIMAGMTEGCGTTKAGFKKAMERLFSLGTIKAQADLWLGSDRKFVQGLARTEKED